MADTAHHTAPDHGFAGPLEPVDDCTWRIPKAYKPGMLVDGLIFADERLIPQLRSDRAPEQVANVACLPGIQTASLAMPDIHWGYGFCIGGVCATDPLPPRAVEDIPNRKRSQRSGIGVAGGFIVTSCPEDSPVNGTFATVVRSVSCMWAQAGR